MWLSRVFFLNEKSLLKSKRNLWSNYILKNKNFFLLTNHHPPLFGLKRNCYLCTYQKSKQWNAFSDIFITIIPPCTNVIEDDKCHQKNFFLIFGLRSRVTHKLCITLSEILFIIVFTLNIYVQHYIHLYAV